MLTLKDLSADKELDRKALTEVRGGTGGVTSTNVQNVTSNGIGGLVGISDVDQLLLAANNDNDVRYSEDYAFNIASPFGIALA